MEQIKLAAEKNRDDLVRFTRDLIAIPSTSGKEGKVVERIKQEMESIGTDEIIVDGLGNILGRIGNGKKVIAIDAHIDTVDVGDPDAWEWDPFKGKVEDGIIFGRGASDMKGAMASIVYGGKIIKDLNLTGDYTLYMVGSVMEEDCDGLCWLYIFNEDKIKPDCVVITEATNCRIYRGQRGRMEMRVVTKGVSCHGSAPERGDNAIYKMMPIVQGIEKLNDRLKDDPFLGKGTITVSQIFHKGPSQCAVPDECSISIDRRLTTGETKQSAVREIEQLFNGVDAKVEVLTYAEKAFTGLVYPMEKYYPTWLMEEDDPLILKSIKAYKNLFDEDPTVDKWVFSTNGVATRGLLGIPTVGFGPANEVYAHTVNDQVPIDDLVRSAMFYAEFPRVFAESK